ncbi:MAG TPA: cation diffusion facilitator family transporter [Gammaproteobacteria bacterium]|nr:cation diffusion facilitator family transporter [Gammaproteobacteria bacterium]
MHKLGENRVDNSRRLGIVLALTLVYMTIEIIGSLLANSLALLADAGHMLSDAGALGLSLLALWIAQMPATSSHTYGYYRTEILAALVNGAALIAVTIFIFMEAYQRIGKPPEIEGALMLGIAIGGLLINTLGLWILNPGKSQNLNVRGARLHLAADALGSLGAIFAGVLIWVFGWNWADPIASVLISVLVVYSSWVLLKETVAVLMESAPGHIDVDEVRNVICRIADVRSAHDLHIWTITSGMVALSVHIVVAGDRPARLVLAELREILHERFGIDHTTIQIESDQYEACEMPV